MRISNLIVEMWSRQQAAAWILPVILAGFLTGESSEALTTFGKTNTQAPYQPPPPTAPPARECSRQADCGGISGTSCVRTNIDRQTRCLCGDNRSPVNGKCNVTFKALHHVCTDSNECGDGLNCMIPNVTSTVATPTAPPRNSWQNNYQQNNLGQNQALDKICLCSEEDGFVEKDFNCSGAGTQKIGLFSLIISFLVFFKNSETKF